MYYTGSACRGTDLPSGRLLYIQYEERISQAAWKKKAIKQSEEKKVMKLLEEKRWLCEEKKTIRLPEKGNKIT